MNRIRVRFLVVACASMASSVLSADPVLSACRDIADPAARLACYDRMVDAPGARNVDAIPKRDTTSPHDAQDEAPGTAGAAKSAGRDSPGTAQDVENPTSTLSFGKREPDERDTPREMRARIISVTQGPLRRDILKLDNGQVWMENEPSARALKPDQNVVITENRFSFTMRLESGRILKVHRID